MVFHFPSFCQGLAGFRSGPAPTTTWLEIAARDHRDKRLSTFCDTVAARRRNQVRRGAGQPVTPPSGQHTRYCPGLQPGLWLADPSALEVAILSRPLQPVPGPRGRQGRAAGSFCFFAVCVRCPWQGRARYGPGRLADFLKGARAGKSGAPLTDDLAHTVLVWPC